MDYNDLMTNVIQLNMHGARENARGSGATSHVSVSSLF